MRAREKIAARALFLIIVVTLAVLPICFLGYFEGHDFAIHLDSWADAAQQFHQGILFPRWASGANYGFGEPRFIFYPPLSWMAGAALGLVLPWKMVPGVYIWLALLLAGAAMWRAASDWLTPSDALMAGVLYALNPYLMVTAYTRSAYPELLASALFPLLVWGGVRIGRDARRTFIPLAVVFAAIWMTNFPVGVIATYTLATLLLIECVSRRSFRPFLSGAAAISAGFGFAAFTVIPAVWEQKWIDIGNVLDPKYVPWHNFLFTRNNELIMLGFNRTMSFLALFLIAVAVMAAALTPRSRHEFPALWCSLAAIAGLSSFAMFPASEILWRHLPELRFVQFPWRWLTPVSVAGVFLSAAAIGQLRRKWPAYLVVVVVFCGVSGNTIYSEVWGSNFPQNIAAAVRSGAGYKGLKEYIPSGSNPLELPLEAPLIVAAEQNQPLTNQARIQTELWAPERKLFSVDSPVPLHLSLRLLAYPAWQVKINGMPAIAGTEPRTGQMSLDAPAGFSRFEVVFARTWDRTAGIAVSLATALALIFLALYFRSRGRFAARVQTDSLIASR